MAEQTAQNKQPSQKKSSTKIPVISTTLKVGGKLLSVCILAGFLSLLFEFALYIILDNPLEESLARYEAISAFTKANWIDEASIAKQAETTIIETLSLAENTERIRHASEQLSMNTQRSDWFSWVGANAGSYVLKAIAAIPDLVTLWAIATFTWIAKMLSITALLLPCVLILGGGFIDGSVQRKIDTFRGVRDSQDKIEWWFLMFKSSSYTVLFLYVAIPNSFQAATLMLPSAIVSAVFLRNVVANYKKYW